MDTKTALRQLEEFTGTSQYHKHLFPGKSPIQITDGCKFLRDECKAYQVFDTILILQDDARLKHVNYQIWEFRQLRSDLTWQLTCRADIGTKPLISQIFNTSESILDYIKIWVIDKVAILPNEY